jgi:hypothetical protein
MRVIIDLPDGQDIPRAEDIKRLTDPNWLSEWWHISDVQYLDESLTDEEAQDVLRMVNKRHDCHIGINWDFIQYFVDEIIKEREDETN